MKGNFRVQKSDIPEVAIGCDHAAEQVNREDKTHSGLKGITRNQTSHNQHYMAATVLAQLQEEMMNKRFIFSSSQSKHYQRSMPYVH